MKEIQAISKLVHKNIVRYQGCWVEADEPDENQLNKIVQKMNKPNLNPFYVEGISENEEDDPEFVMNVELIDEVQKNLRERPLSNLSS